MKVGDLVLRKHVVVGEVMKFLLSRVKSKEKLGIVKILKDDLVKVHWQDGDETWLLAEQLEVINESR